MSSASDPSGTWERVAAELRACKESQQQAWGNVDNALLGRYLAGELSPGEQAELEQALARLPELRKLTDLVQDVLRDLEPIDNLPPIPVPAAAAVVVPFTPRRPRRFTRWARRFAPLAAAACLLLVFGALMPRPGFLSAPRPSAPATEGAVALGPGPAGTVAPEGPMIFLSLAPEDSPVEPAPLPAPRLEPPAAPARTLADARPLPPPAEPQTPAQLHRAVNFYHAQGDVARAARTLRKAHHHCKNKLGPQHRTTQWTARQLAGVYQVALNTPDPAGSKGRAGFAGAVRAKTPSRPGAPARGWINPSFRARLTAQQVRQDLNSRPAREVVPVLAQALRTSHCPRERQALVRALGELGPAARQAVPILAERLRQSSDAGEQRVLLTALERIGPAADDAVPVLVALADNTATASLSDRDSKFMAVRTVKTERSERTCRLADDEAQLARKVLARLSGPEARVGVFDNAGLFSVGGIIDTTRALRHAQRTHHLAVRIETRTGGTAQVVPSEMGPRALLVCVGPDAQVQVQASPTLRAQGLNPASLETQLSALSKKNEHDRILTTVLARVDALEKTGKK